MKKSLLPLVLAALVGICSTTSPVRAQLTLLEDGIENTGQAPFEIRTTGGLISLIVDADGDTFQQEVVRIFNNGDSLSNRVLQVGTVHTGSPEPGSLLISGTLYQNFGFDLAEAFLARQPLKAGEVVAVDSVRPDAVRRARGAADQSVLGVVSDRPGVVLGGGAFSVERLEENWGSEVAERFRAEQAALETEALTIREDLQRLAGRVAPERVPPSPVASLVAGAGPGSVGDASRSTLEQELEAAALDLFFERNFVEVALAGRVPVQVDAVNGAIRPGDFLGPGPIAGTAAKAIEPGPVVGVALESHLSGSGEILMLVDRGWFGGGSRSLAASNRAEVEALRAVNASLERRLSQMESVLRRLLGDQVRAQHARQ